MVRAFRVLEFKNVNTHFNHAVRVVLQHEGGYVNHAADPGGATNYGISLRWLQKQGELDGIAEFDIDGDGDIDADDIRAMSIDQARDIYFRHWWKRYKYNRIVSGRIATKVLDLSVNMGGRQAHKLLQRACATAHRPLVDDGILGHQSFDAINSVDDGILIGAFRSEAKYFYLHLIDKKPQFEAFKTGWLRRAIE